MNRLHVGCYIEAVPTVVRMDEDVKGCISCDSIQLDGHYCKICGNKLGMAKREGYGYHVLYLYQLITEELVKEKHELLFESHVINELEYLFPVSVGDITNGMVNMTHINIESELNDFKEKYHSFILDVGSKYQSFRVCFGTVSY